MSFLDKKVGPFFAFQFIGIVGAILVLVAFFLSWADVTTTILGGTRTTGYTGMQFFDGEYLQDKDAWQNMVPLIALILAIVALIISVVPSKYLGGAKTEGILGIVAIVISVVLLVVSILFMVWLDTGASGGSLLGGSVGYGIGTYLCLVGSILVFIVGVLPIIKNLTA